jgi:hypothetical protein
MRQIIFLDIDGTLLPITENINSITIPKKIVNIWNDFVAKIPKCEIVFETHLYETFDELKHFTNNNNLFGNFIDKTKHFSKRKGDEIQEWLSSNNINILADKFCIFDDLSSVVFNDYQIPFHIKINYNFGIEEKDLQKALEILKYNEY